MNETEFIWMDGTFVPWQDAKIHVLTHTLHYGMGVFEGIRFYETTDGPAIFRLQEHTERFFFGARDALLELPFSKKEINDAIIETVRINKLQSGYIRPLAYFGYGKMGLNPRGAPTNVAIAVWPWGSYLGDDAVKVKTSRFKRIHPDSTHVEAKICGHYINSILASVDVRDQGYHEALLMDHYGCVGEGPGENIFIVSEGILITPGPGSILRGITRRSIMKIAKDQGIPVEERSITQDDIHYSDEAFFTGTAAELTPIYSVDDRKIGKACPGPVTLKLQNIFMEIIHGRNEKYKDWLTIVR